MTRSTVIQRCAEDDVRFVRLVYVGNDGVLRGKVVDSDDIESVLDGGINVPRVTQSFTFIDHVVPDGQYDEPGEARIVPDPDTFHTLPYANGTAIAVCSLRDVRGDPWDADPRSVLASFLEDLNAEGLSPSVAFEPEFALARETEEGLVPTDRSLGYSVDSMQDNHSFLLDLVDAIESLGMDFESYVPEYGVAQQEIAVGSAHGLRAADNHVLFRQAARSIAADHEVTATFLPKPFDKGTNGCHVHLSLWRDDQNHFYDADADETYGLSDRGRWFVGGILDHAPALVALTAPTPMSYERLEPGTWASAFTCWGYDNREAAVRIPSTRGGSRAETARIEYKPADNTANPYLVVLGLLAAGLDGIEHEIDPGEPLDVKPATLSAQEREDRDIKSLPTSLDAALDALEEDDVLRDALGPSLFQSYHEVKRYEAEAAADAELEELVRAF